MAKPPPPGNTEVFRPSTTEGNKAKDEFDKGLQQAEQEAEQQKVSKDIASASAL